MVSVGVALGVVGVAARVVAVTQAHVPAGRRAGWLVVPVTALTPRQQQILELMAEGLKGPQIAARLWLGTATVKTHQRALYACLGVRNGPAAVAAGYRTGLLDAPDTITSKEHSTMNDPIALAAELKRKDQLLRETETQLGQERRRTADLTQRLTVALLRIQALQVHEAIVRIPAQPPDPDGGLCEPILYEKPIRDVTTGGLL